MALTLKIAQQSFCTTLWLVTMHHNTKFGHKMFGSLEDIIWTNIDILTQYNFFQRTLLLIMMYIRPSLVAEESTVQKIQQKESYFDHKSPHCDLSLKIANISA